jgi:hypothetical protein
LPKKPSLFSGCLRGLQNAQDPYTLYSFDRAWESTVGWTPTPNCCVQFVHTCFWFYTFLIQETGFLYSPAHCSTSFSGISIQFIVLGICKFSL